MNRLRSAYASLWAAHPLAVWAGLLAIFISSLTAFVLAAIELSPLAALALACLVGAGLLLRFAPDDESGGDS